MEEPAPRSSQAMIGDTYQYDLPAKWPEEAGKAQVSAARCCPRPVPREPSSLREALQLCLGTTKHPTMKSKSRTSDFHSFHAGGRNRSQVHRAGFPKGPAASKLSTGGKLPSLAPMHARWQSRCIRHVTSAHNEHWLKVREPASHLRNNIP